MGRVHEGATRGGARAGGRRRGSEGPRPRRGWERKLRLELTQGWAQRGRLQLLKDTTTRVLSRSRYGHLQGSRKV
eukprot:365278-Chlamydomonas_euryale.AAC.12